MPLFAALMIVLAFLGPITADPGFDSAQWKAQYGTGAVDNPRGGMVGDVEDLLHPGMSRSEVVDLLGKPEQEERERFTYEIGVSPYGIDYEYFVIEFASDELVRTYITRG